MSFNLKVKLRPRHKRAMQSGLREAAKLTVVVTCVVTLATLFLIGLFLIAEHGSPLWAVAYLLSSFFLFCWVGATYDALRRQREEDKTDYEYYLR